MPRTSSEETSNTAARNAAAGEAVAKSAPPPWHTVALVGAMIAVVVSSFPTVQEIDQVVTATTFTNRVFPLYLSIKLLGSIRCAFALFIFGVSFKAVFFYPG